jgi:hypothetical protein
MLEQTKRSYVSLVIIAEYCFILDESFWLSIKDDTIALQNVFRWVILCQLYIPEPFQIFLPSFICTF